MLVGAQIIVGVVLIYCAEVSTTLLFEGESIGLDLAHDIHSRDHYIYWRSWAREALLSLVILWIAALLLAWYARLHKRRFATSTQRYGSRGALATTALLP